MMVIYHICFHAIYTYVFMYYWIACYFIFFIWECRISIYMYTHHITYMVNYNSTLRPNHQQYCSNNNSKTQQSPIIPQPTVHIFFHHKHHIIYYKIVIFYWNYATLIWIILADYGWDDDMYIEWYCSLQWKYSQKVSEMWKKNHQSIKIWMKNYK